MNLANSGIFDVNDTGFGGDGDANSPEWLGGGRCITTGHFADLARAFAARGFGVLVLCGPAERVVAFSVTPPARRSSGQEQGRVRHSGEFWLRLAPRAPRMNAALVAAIEFRLRVGLMEQTTYVTSSLPIVRQYLGKLKRHSRLRSGITIYSRRFLA